MKLCNRHKMHYIINAGSHYIYRVDIFKLTGTTSKYLQLPWCSNNGTNCNTISFKIILKPLDQLADYGNTSLTAATVLYKCLYIKDLDQKSKRSENLEEFFPTFSIDISSVTFNSFTPHVKVILRFYPQLNVSNTSLTAATVLYKCLYIKDLDQKSKRSENLEEFFPTFSIDISSVTFNSFTPHVKVILRFYPQLNIKTGSQIYCIRFHVHKRNIFSYPCSLVKSTEDYIYCRCDGNGLFSLMISSHSASGYWIHDYLHPKLYIVSASIIIIFVILQNIFKITWRLKKNIFLLA
ncbi:hypothetical protein NPIL_151482 [Nephila pilipes]|uniref:Uncharacterized protein n=1 Tax=Nephila pilipes TaxID=299642 RepID=A0A8X6JUZ7_NEPPI|nr:hypothetical protein NPIL_151482 [Nephila pilipes]